MMQTNVRACKREWEDIQAKWFLPRYFAKKKFLKAFQIYGRVDASNIDEVFTLIGDYQNRQDVYQKHIGLQGANGRQNFDQDVQVLHHQLMEMTDQLQAKTNQENAIEDIAVSSSWKTPGSHTCLHQRRIPLSYLCSHRCRRTAALIQQQTFQPAHRTIQARHPAFPGTKQGRAL